MTLRGRALGETVVATPKYARQHGFRTDVFKDTLARLHLPVSAAEWSSYFAPSINDPVVRSSVGPQLTGRNGYIDFVLQRVNFGLTERVQLSPTLADNFVMYAFGQDPPTWGLTGLLLNTREDEQATAMLRLYLELGRASRLAQRQKSISVRADSFVIVGALTGFNGTLDAATETFVPFSLSMVVKRVALVNYNAGWQPYAPSGAFVDDPNIERPDPLVNTSAPRQVVATTPAGAGPHGAAETPPPSPAATSAAAGRPTPSAETPETTTRASTEVETTQQRANEIRERYGRLLSPATLAELGRLADGPSVTGLPTVNNAPSAAIGRPDTSILGEMFGRQSAQESDALYLDQRDREFLRQHTAGGM